MVMDSNLVVWNLLEYVLMLHHVIVRGMAVSVLLSIDGNCQGVVTLPWQIKKEVSLIKLHTNVGTYKYIQYSYIPPVCMYIYLYIYTYLCRYVCTFST